MNLETIDPATGSVVQTYSASEPQEIHAALDAAVAAQAVWRRRAVAERVQPLAELARHLEEDADRHAQLMTTEMGKPIAQGRSEAEKCAWACRYVLENAESQLAAREVSTESAVSRVVFQPLGVLLAIMPWNFPYWQVIRAAVPAITAGNAVVLKHASNVLGCAHELAEIMTAAGYPEGLFSSLRLDNESTSKLIADQRVAAVTLTGSVRAGRAVAAAAGKALKKTVLELGGSDAYVILADADLELAVEKCSTSRLINSGQSCIGAKRFVAVDAVREEFESRLVERLAAARMGDPSDEASDLGPLAREDLRVNLHRQVTESVAAGAELALGGEIPDGPGWFYPPTVLTNVTPGMPAYEEELFGPVAAILPAGDEAAAVAIANDSSYGLGAAVFTQDVARGLEIAQEELAAGSTFVNDFVRSDPRLPFGGIKDSGYGRELSPFGIREFVNVKTVVAAGEGD